MTTNDTADSMSTSDSKKDADSSSKSSNKENKSNSILLVPFPKFIFMYPTLIVATIASIIMYFGGFHAVDPETQTTPVVLTSIFLVVMMANMFVIIFDFPRATSLTLIFIITTIMMGVFILTLVRPGMLPSFESLLSGIRPAANTTFFMCIAGSMMLMYVAVFVSVKFNYWELRNNELLHHHGFLSDLKRYPAPNLRVDKEINDVFEFVLLGAGRLILHPSTEKRSIVLDNILFVGSKERELTRMLGSIRVKIGGDSSGNN